MNQITTRLLLHKNRYLLLLNCKFSHIFLCHILLFFDIIFYEKCKQLNSRENLRCYISKIITYQL